MNLSLGAVPGAQALTITGLESSVTEALAYATQRGALVVAAAGNESFPVCDTPSFENGALCVTSTTRQETPSYFGNGDVKPGLFAVAGPGAEGLVSCRNEIVSTVPRGTGAASCGQSSYDYYRRHFDGRTARRGCGRPAVRAGPGARQRDDGTGRDRSHARTGDRCLHHLLWARHRRRGCGHGVPGPSTTQATAPKGKKGSR